MLKRTWPSTVKPMQVEWTVDLIANTVTHREGWVFQLKSHPDDDGGLMGECIAQPNPMTAEHMAQAPRIARLAGEAFMMALRNEPRH